MLAGHRLALALGVVDSRAVNGDDDLSRKQLVRAGEAMVNAGLAVILNHPGTKKPLCTLTAVERKQANQDAQDAAAASGDPLSHRRKHNCGFGHAITDLKTATRVLTRISKRQRFNIGIDPRASKVLIVDLDTAAQGADFWLRCGETRPALTVRSPGKRDGEGRWMHKDGGHIWFDVPDDLDLPMELGGYADPSGWKAMWGGCQVLVPPSAREEGSYVLVGSSHPMPQFLIDLVITAGIEKRERIERSAKRRANSTPSKLDDWATDTPWADILLAAEWTATGLIKSCGCPQWTAPGDHGSPESGTAHEVGCSYYACDRGHGPLMVWTDNPGEVIGRAQERFGRGPLTKPEVYCCLHGDGDMLRTFEEIGLPVGPTVLNRKFLTWKEIGEEDTKPADPVEDSPEEDSEPGDDEDPEADADEKARRAAEHEEFLTRLEVDRERRRRKARERVETESAPPLRVFNASGLTRAPRPKGMA